MAKTTITVQEDTLERFNRLKREFEPDGENTSANLFLCMLLDVWETEIGPSGDDPVRYHTLDGVIQYIAAEMDFPTSDVKEAVREVLKEELPPGALR